MTPTYFLGHSLAARPRFLAQVTKLLAEMTSATTSLTNLFAQVAKLLAEITSATISLPKLFAQVTIVVAEMTSATISPTKLFAQVAKLLAEMTSATTFLTKFFAVLVIFLAVASKLGITGAIKDPFIRHFGYTAKRYLTIPPGERTGPAQATLFTSSPMTLDDFQS